MTMTSVRSAYPAPVEALMPKARQLAEAEGLPSRNRLKTALRVGAPKANQVRAALMAEGWGDSRVATPRPATAEAYEAMLEGLYSAPDSLPGSGRSGPDSAAVPNSAELPPVRGDAAGSVASVPQEEPVVDPTESDAAPVAVSAEPAAEQAVSDVPVDAVPRERIAVWPVLLLCLPATVAIWSGWVGLGSLAGFGPIHPLPGIWDSLVIDTSITLPIGMETYSAYALYVWLSGRASKKAVAFARVSALIALSIGAAGQIAYHLMAAPDDGAGPVITATVACIPVAVLGMGASLAHLVKNTEN